MAGPSRSEMLPAWLLSCSYSPPNSSDLEEEAGLQSLRTVELPQEDHQPAQKGPSRPLLHGSDAQRLCDKEAVLLLLCVNPLFIHLHPTNKGWLLGFASAFVGPWVKIYKTVTPTLHPQTHDCGNVPWCPQDLYPSL